MKMFDSNKHQQPNRPVRHRKFEWLESRLMLAGDLADMVHLARLEIDHGPCEAPFASVAGYLADDESGEAVVGRMILLTGIAHDGELVAIFRTTDARGAFAFEDLHTGRYTVMHVEEDAENQWSMVDTTAELMLQPGDAVLDLVLGEETLLEEIVAATRFVAAEVSTVLVDSSESVTNTAEVALDRAFSEFESYFREIGRSQGEDPMIEYSIARPNPTDVASAEIRGTVFQDLNNDSTRNEEEPRCEGVVVRLRGWSDSGRSIECRVRSDARGEYEFSELPSGIYRISIEHEGTEGRALEKEFTLVSGQKVVVDLARQIEPTVPTPLPPVIPEVSSGRSSRSLLWMTLSLFGFTGAVTLYEDGRDLKRLLVSRRQKLAKRRSVATEH